MDFKVKSSITVDVVTHILIFNFQSIDLCHFEAPSTMEETPAIPNMKFIRKLADILSYMKNRIHIGKAFLHIFTGQE